MSDQITGTTAADIADSVRGLRDRGVPVSYTHLTLPTNREV